MSNTQISITFAIEILITPLMKTTSEIINEMYADMMAIAESVERKAAREKAFCDDIANYLASQDM